MNDKDSPFSQWSPVNGVAEQSQWNPSNLSRHTPLTQGRDGHWGGVDRHPGSIPGITWFLTYDSISTTSPSLILKPQKHPRKYFLSRDQTCHGSWLGLSTAPIYRWLPRSRSSSPPTIV